MATLTASQSGNLSSSSTWGGSSFADNDLLVIGNGYTVTVDINCTIGDLPGSSTSVITCSGTGSITFNTDIAATIRGVATIADGEFKLMPGVAITWATTSGVNYYLTGGTGTSSTKAITFAGTSAKPCSITKSGDGTFRGIYNTGYAKFNWSYFTLTGAGAASTQCTRFQNFNECNLDHVKIVSCGQLLVDTQSATAVGNLDWSYVTIASTIESGGTSMIYQVNSSVGSYHRRITKSSLGRAYWTGCASLEVTKCILAGGRPISTAPNPTKFEDIFCTRDTYILAETMQRVYILMNEENPHFLYPGMPVSGASKIDGVIFDVRIDDGYDGGDGLCLDAATSTTAVSVKNAIVLPGPANDPAGTVFTGLGGSANASASIENCTCYCGVNGGVAVAETGDGHAGVVTSVQNNIFWSRDQVDNTRAIRSQSVTIVDDYLTTVDYNGLYQIDAPYSQVDADAFASTPGTNDITGDPNFYDDTRNHVTWGEDILGFTGTFAQVSQDVVDYLSVVFDFTDANFDDDAIDHTSLYAYVRDGFAPQNADYSTASSTGGIIGAVAYRNPFVELTATSETTSVGSGDLIAGIALDADVVSETAGSASLTVGIALDASGNTATQAAGTLAKQLSVHADVDSATSAQAQVTRGILFNATATGRSSAAATLYRSGVAVPLVATVATTSAADATIMRQVALASTATNVTQGDADLFVRKGQVSFVADCATVVSGDASLRKTLAFFAQSSSDTAIASDLFVRKGDVSLIASGASTTAAAAALNKTLSMDASCLMTTDSIAELFVRKGQVAFDASGIARTSSAALLKKQLSLSSASTVASDVTADLFIRKGDVQFMASSLSNTTISSVLKKTLSISASSLTGSSGTSDLFVRKGYVEVDATVANKTIANALLKKQIAMVAQGANMTASDATIDVITQTVDLEAQVASSSASDASLQRMVVLVADVSSGTFVDSDLFVRRGSVALVADMATDSSCAAQLKKQIDLTAQVDGSNDIQAGLYVQPKSIDLVATVANATRSDASLRKQFDLSAHLAMATSSTADLRILGRVPLDAMMVSGTSGAVRMDKVIGMVATCATHVQGHGVLRKRGHVQGGGALLAMEF